MSLMPQSEKKVRSTKISGKPKRLKGDVGVTASSTNTGTDGDQVSRGRESSEIDFHLKPSYASVKSRELTHKSTGSIFFQKIQPQTELRMSDLEDDGSIRLLSLMHAAKFLGQAMKGTNVEEKKATFIKYLTMQGIKSFVIRCYVGLYEEENKPNNAIEWILRLGSFGVPETSQIEKAQEDIKNLRALVDEALEENAKLKAALKTAEGEGNDAACKDWKYYMNFDYSQLGISKEEEEEPEEDECDEK